jgi:ADP-heptose:LPS heptosyltransferase
VPARAWSPERHRELVGTLARSRPVVVTGSPSERDLTAFVSEGAAGATNVVDAGGRLTFAELGEALARAALVVTGNTGPAHLAAAVGTPVVSLYAPTVPAVRWRPWGVPHALLGQQDIGCAGCRARICPVAGHPCVESVTVAEVVGAVDELLGAGAVPAPPTRNGRVLV